jgi:hypothetical protein
MVYSVMSLPIDSWNSFAKVLLSFFSFQTIYMAVNAASLLDSGNSSAHPVCTPSKLFVRSMNWPVQSVFQWYQAVDRSNQFTLEVTFSEGNRLPMAVSGAVGVAVGMTAVQCPFSP